MSDALLILPRLRVQNANAISSPMTWGFPAMSAFIGLMQALERRLPANCRLELSAAGVICHDFEPQTARNGYTRTFRLTRNPVDRTGATAAIVEEGRAHLTITLVLAAHGEVCSGEKDERDAVANEIGEILAGMRIAGGSVIPPVQTGRGRRHRPLLEPLDDRSEERDKQFRRLCRQWLPGFALVSRDDLLARRLAEIREETPEATALDAWLDLSRLNHECHVTTTVNDQGEPREEVAWEVRRPPGWVVPIPVGYGAISELFPAGTVANARDQSTPFRFVESLYSIGQWVSPHRLRRIDDLLWYVDNDLDAGLYRLNNDYRPRA
jgi:CRISPR-associated protein Csy2